MKQISLILATLCAMATATAADARTLHYMTDAGEGSVTLTDEYKTYPALHLQMEDGEMAFGALYDVDDITPPVESLHIGYDNKDYWAGPWCPWWQYLPAGTRECTDIPAEMYNRFLTMEEVQQYIIPSDINAWELISACHENLRCSASAAYTAPTCACAAGTLQPGRYLFLNKYAPSLGATENGNVARIAIFDHPVSYRSVHGDHVYAHAIDTQHEEFVSPNITLNDWKSTSNDTNVSNLPEEANLYVYRLSIK